MNESDFEELVNLYFDREISGTELECLKKELAENADRKSDFQLRYRLHKATCMALCTEGVGVADPCITAARECKPSRTNYTAFFSLGMAACLLFVLTISMLVVRNPANDERRFVEKPVEYVGEVVHNAGREPESRFQEEKVSLELQFAEFTNGITSLDPSFRSADTQVLWSKESNLESVMEPIDLYEKRYTLTPESQVLESFKRVDRASSSGNWPAGFKSTLAGF